MKKITIQQAIFLLSNLSAKENQLTDNLYSYKVPLLVNGKDVTDSKKIKQMKKDLENLSLIQQDIINLKSKLAKINISTEINIENNQKLLNQLLEEVRIKRSYLAALNNLVKSSYTKIETGVGVVQYGVLNEDLLREKIENLETEVNNLSQKIDIINSTTYIEIDLLSEK